jgi:hypothetical protein
VFESNELNNEATRAIIVGESANLYFQAFQPSNYNPEEDSTIRIISRIGNAGDLACEADVDYFYVNDNLDTIFIGSTHINVGAHDSIDLNTPWVVADPRTTIIARIVNSSILEYTYDDNEGNFKLGDLKVILFEEPYCDYGPPVGITGYIHSEVFGGVPPYTYNWNTGSVLPDLNATPGTYTLTVTDNTGQAIQANGTIAPCPPVFLAIKLLIQGYYSGNDLMRPVLKNEGVFAWHQVVDTVQVDLRKDSTGYPLVGSAKGLLLRNGTLRTYFNDLNILGTSCYLIIKHRNSMETWSSLPVSIQAITQYNFSDSITKAYGNNLTLLTDQNTIQYGIYTGDINHDDNIDLLDNLLLELSINEFEFGYKPTDLNGDGNVDLLDNPFHEDNIINFVFGQYP